MQRLEQTHLMDSLRKCGRGASSDAYIGTEFETSRKFILHIRHTKEEKERKSQNPHPCPYHSVGNYPNFYTVRQK